MLGSSVKKTLKIFTKSILVSSNCQEFYMPSGFHYLWSTFASQPVNFSLKQKVSKILIRISLKQKKAQSSQNRTYTQAVKVIILTKLFFFPFVFIYISECELSKYYVCILYVVHKIDKGMDNKMREN